ncbi:MAG: tail fiber domain-containing protein [Paludibacter sp.]|nr:tail fiber domain-containing protein [Paludibacter sp.]
MKTTKIIFTVTLFLISISVNAQLKVSNTGNIGIKLLGTNNPLSALSIGGIGSGSYQAYIGNSGYNTTLKVEKTSPFGSGMIFYGIDASVYPSYNTPSYNYGIKGQSYSSSFMPYARTYGVLGIAGNGCPGYNYGVLGQLSGNSSGAGIIGMVSSSSYPEIAISGMYAGYFVGSVKSTCAMEATAFTLTSDKRYKKNIVTIDQSKSINGILALNPVEYNLEQRYYKTPKDSAKTETPYYDEKSQLFQKKHFGIIAQELQLIYPELVYEDTDGYLSVDYTGLIPLLIQSVKELKSEIDNLKIKNIDSGQAKIKSSEVLPEETNALTYPVLEQNIPNPFNVSTAISYYLPNTITTAAIYIYDMNGVQLKSFSISQLGKGNITIQGSEFIAGMYLYALIVDGKVIDTKRMILTK